MINQPSRYAWFVFAISACFLFFKYILQISPSVMTQELMKAYSLTGAELGVLVGFYFYTYLLVQIPSGILLDRYGPRRVTSFAIICCIVGVFLFSTTDSWWIACIARLMIGLGAGFATTSYMKLTSQWFPLRYFPLMSGFFVCACMAGACTAQAPIAWLVNDMGWRETLFMFGVVGVGLLVIFALFVRDQPKAVTLHSTTDASKLTWAIFKEVLRNRSNWPLMLYGGLGFIPTAVFGGLWGTPFLMTAYDLSKTAASLSVSFAFLGMAIGSIFAGWIGKISDRQLPAMAWGTALSLICLGGVIYIHNLPLWLLNSLIFGFGFFSSTFLLSYGIARNLNNPLATATVIGLVNMGDPLCGSIAEPLIGKILDLNWDGKLVDGARVFSLPAYEWGLSLLVIYLSIALVCCYFIKEPRLTSNTTSLSK